MGFKPGLIVKLTDNGRRNAIVLGERDHVIKLYADGGFTHVLGHQVSVPRKPVETFIPMRLRLPYGHWFERDGTRVLFSRDYCPLWKLSPDGALIPDEPWRLVKHVREETFWSDRDAPWISRDTAWNMATILSDIGVKDGTPLLSVAVRYLVDGATDIHDAVHRMTPAGVLNSAQRLLRGFGQQPAVHGALC